MDVFANWFLLVLASGGPAGGWRRHDELYSVDNQKREIYGFLDLAVRSSGSVFFLLDIKNTH